RRTGLTPKVFASERGFGRLSRISLEKYPIHQVKSPAMIPLTLATRNSHKTVEFASLLEGFSVSDLTGRRDLPVIAETGGSFEENATLKAIGISRLLPGL